MPLRNPRRSSIPKTITLLCDCWRLAETRTSDHLSAKNPDSGEEFITQLFWGYLNETLISATRSESLKRAFEADLLAAFPKLHAARWKVDRFCQALVMDCQLHDKTTEGRTGGDFGLTIIRPSLNDSPYARSIPTKRQGLLCQSKLKAKNSRWRKLTKPQCKALAPSLAYTSLVLYEFTDRHRNRLLPFVWQPCNGAKVENVTDWLKTGRFPSAQTSEVIIRALADCLVGTSDQDIIDEQIAVVHRPSVVIRIDWPDDQKPPPISQLIAQHAPVPQLVYA